MPYRNSFNSILHFVRFLVKQTTTKRPENGNYSVNIPSLVSHALSPQTQKNVETTANKKYGSQNQNQVVLVSGVSQKSNTIRFRLRHQISQEIAGECKYACELVMLKASQSLQQAGLFNIVVFVY